MRAFGNNVLARVLTCALKDGDVIAIDGNRAVNAVPVNKDEQCPDAMKCLSLCLAACASTLGDSDPPTGHQELRRGHRSPGHIALRARLVTGTHCTATPHGGRINARGRRLLALAAEQAIKSPFCPTPALFMQI